ncbi:MAG: Na+/H+ antiporter [Parachlamydia sp.]|nr:Na+/H+ antiporter [Parachlamydia sp.]
MSSIETLILLMAAAIILVGVAQKMRIPYPLILVLGGAVIGFIPFIKDVPYNPQTILTIVLPPILYYGAFWTSYREFKASLWDIFSMALGLVCVTTLGIGLLFKWLFPEYPWSLAFAFGAIVSPPDATAVTAILKRFNISSRLLSILEGESLVNDAAALVFYKLAIVALLTGTFSWTEGSFNFIKSVAGGGIFGFAFGYAIQKFSAVFLPPVVGVMFSFTIPYTTYVLADSLGVSGVLAVVVNGLVLSRIYISHLASVRRILAVTPWDMFIILINCFVFIMIGLQLSPIVAKLPFEKLITYSLYGLFFTVALLAIRMMWVYFKHGVAYFRARRDPSLVATCPQILREGAILGWAGMRGIVSLTAVLALPFYHADGTSVPGRDATVYITFVIILLTLLIPGLTLPTLLRWLKIHHHPDTSLQTHRKRLLDVAKNEIQAFAELSDEEREFLLSYFHSRHHIVEISSSKNKSMQNLDSVRRKILETQRQHLLKMLNDGEIDDKQLKLLELELDLEESLLIRAEIK